MKKFLMTSPFQEKLDKYVYSAVDNSKLQYDKPIRFPILTAINGYINKGESIEIIVIKAECKMADKNYNLFQSELEELSIEKGFSYTIQTIDVPYNDELDTHLLTFQKLIDITNDNDTLYACITYGTKPTPIIEIMALNYAYRIKKNVSIECIVYGTIDFNANPKKAYTYDITSLFYMDEIVRILAENKVADPSKHIKALLDSEL